MGTVWGVLRPGEPGLRERLEALDGLPAKEVRRRHGPEVARFVSRRKEIARRARARFPDGRMAAGTSRGLEQATALPVARHRAGRFRRAAKAVGDLWAWDACAGIGADAMAMAEAGLTVLATDLSAEALGCAAINAALLDPQGVVLPCLADALRPPFASGERILGLADPDRRDAHGRRLRDPEDWSPPLGRTLQLVAGLRGGCVKLAPGLDPAALQRHLPPGCPASLEWISLDGELKELALWTGILAEEPHPERATLLRSDGGSDSVTAASFGPAVGAPERLPDPGELAGWWLLEVPSALTLSGLGDLALGAAGALVLDPSDPGAFAVAPPSAEPSGPGLRAWRIARALPADPKRLRRALRDEGIGTVTVKTRGRGVPEAGALAERLRGSGSRSGLLAITTWPGAERRPRRVGLLLDPARPG